MRRPEAGEIWSDSGVGLAWKKVKVLEVLGGFISYSEVIDGIEDVRAVPGFVESFVKRYNPPAIHLPDAQAVLPLTATGFRPATLNGMAWPDDAIIANVLVRITNGVLTAVAVEPDAELP